jgi:ubiquinone/menaquinone biosynthesis C-methylase UbiE
MIQNNHLTTVFFCLFIMACITIAGQDQSALTLPNEVRLNQRQPPDSVLSSIGIIPGMMVGEVGAGRGRYTVQIASRIGPAGLIYANDIREGSLQFLDDRCEEHGLNNVKTILGSVTKTNLPAGVLDLVIMVNVVHHLEKPVVLLKDVCHSLKPEGFVAIVEGSLEKEPSAAGEWFPRNKLLKIYEDAGYTLVREETFLPKDNIYILKPGN